jgi:Domain of unknown function (DUF4149)
VRLRGLAVVCVAAWVGISAFFSFAVAQLVFRTIERGVAAQAVTAVLPHYYVWGVALSAVAVLAYAVAVVGSREGRLRAIVATLLCGAMLGALLWAWLVVSPRAEAARRARADTTFVRAHRAAVRLNGFTLAAGAAVLVLEGLRRAPRRSR